MYEENAPDRRALAAGREVGVRGQDGHRHCPSRPGSPCPSEGVRASAHSSRVGAQGARGCAPAGALVVWQAPGSMIVLVDTSVWIRFLSNRGPEAAQLGELLRRDEVSGHDFIYGELLIGDTGGRRRLLTDYELMH